MGNVCVHGSKIKLTLRNHVQRAMSDGRARATCGTMAQICAFENRESSLCNPHLRSRAREHACVYRLSLAQRNFDQCRKYARDLQIARYRIVCLSCPRRLNHLALKI